MKRDLWLDDKIQIARLLSEINYIGLTDGQLEQLEVSMDLEREFIFEIFDRAENIFRDSIEQLFKK